MRNTGLLVKLTIVVLFLLVVEQARCGLIRDYKERKVIRRARTERMQAVRGYGPPRQTRPAVSSRNRLDSQRRRTVRHQYRQRRAYNRHVRSLDRYRRAQQRSYNRYRFNQRLRGRAQGASRAYHRFMFDAFGN